MFDWLFVLIMACSLFSYFVGVLIAMWIFVPKLQRLKNAIKNYSIYATASGAAPFGSTAEEKEAVA